MEAVTLMALMEADRAALVEGMARDRSPEAAQTLLERALDRLLMRYTEQCEDAASRDAAQIIVKTLKSAVPFVDSIGETRRWTREASGAAGRKWKPMTLGLLAGGALLVLASLFALMLAGGGAPGPVRLIEALLCAALGVGAAFRAGLTAGKPDKAKADAGPAREEYLVDPERVWRHLRGMLLIADDAIARAKAEAEIRSQADADGGAMDNREVGLFAGLLESAYAQDNADAREMIEAMRFYLHGAGIEAEDYAPGREAWFEFLPAGSERTLRPALVRGQKVLKKGLAAR